jgi:hypothetical protein
VIVDCNDEEQLELTAEKYISEMHIAIEMTKLLWLQATTK